MTQREKNQLKRYLHTVACVKVCIGRGNVRTVPRECAGWYTKAMTAADRLGRSLEEDLEHFEQLQRHSQQQLGRTVLRRLLEAPLPSELRRGAQLPAQSMASALQISPVLERSPVI